jgi:hypothetical protein
MSDVLFGYYDLDKDGKVSQQEFQTFQEDVEEQPYSQEGKRKGQQQ